MEHISSCMQTTVSYWAPMLSVVTLPHIVGAAKLLGFLVHVCISNSVTVNPKSLDTLLASIEKSYSNPPLINSHYWTFVLDVSSHSHTFTHPQLNVSNVCKPLSLWCWAKGTFSSPDEDLTMNRCSRLSGFSWGALSLKEGNATYVFNRL